MKNRDGHSENDREQRSKIIPVTDIRSRRQEEPDGDMTSHEEDEQYRQRLAEHDRGKRQSMVLSAITLLIVVVALLVWRYSIPYSSASEVWTKEQPAAHTFVGIPFADGFLKYNNDGMSYYSSAGEMRWTKTYEMSHPKPYICGDFVVMADIGAKSLIICNVDGYQGAASSPLPVSTLSVSKAGVVAAVVEEELGNHILFFDKTGSKLEIDIRTLMNQSGYPLSVGFSPDGKMLMVSYVYLDQAIINNKIVFYNFHESATGSERLVGAFQKYDGTLFGRVQFLDDRNAVALGDGKLVFYSVKNRLSPAEVRAVDFQQTIVRVFCEGTSVVVITRNDQNNHYVITVLGANGSQQLKFESDYLPDHVGVKKDRVFFYNSNTLTVYSKVLGKYQKRFEGHFSATLRTVINSRDDNEYMILSDAEILKIQLKK